MPTREEILQEIFRIRQENIAVSLFVAGQAQRLGLPIEDFPIEELRRVYNAILERDDVSSSANRREERLPQVEEPIEEPQEETQRSFFENFTNQLSANNAENEIQSIDEQIEQIDEEIDRLNELDIEERFQVNPAVVQGRTFLDHAISLTLPFDRQERKELNAPVGANFVEINPEYNFYLKRFEEVTNKNNIDERLLPNLYVFASELEAGNTDEQNSLFRQHLTLFNAIPNTFVDVVNSRGEKIGERDRGQYFDQYARILPRINTGSSDFVNLIDSFTNIAVPISNIEFLNNYNEKAELFPMFVDIRFRTDPTTQFAEILKDTSLSSVLVTDIIDERISSAERSFFIATGSIIGNIDSVSNNVSSFRANIRIWDVEEWIDSLSTQSFRKLENGIFLGKYNNEISRLSSGEFNFAKQLSILIFNGKLKKLVDNEQRTYEEILDGKFAYNETVFYEIEKVDSVSNNVIQRFFLPNSNDVDELRFVDTQVKYNKRYQYNIFAYQFIIGNKYEYFLRGVSSQDANVRMVNQPSLKIARIPYYSFTGRVMDRPPVFPELNVITFRGVKNKVKFNLNSNVGVYRLMPQIISDKDQEIINQIREAQKVKPSEPITYTTDDRVSAFEVYRLNEKPRRLEDFVENKIGTIKTDIDGASLQAASAASFIDEVLPNTKYYYVFRAIDVHGHISNPTPIYEVELLETDGAVFSSVRIVEFDDGSEQRTNVKSGTRFVQIRPAFAQTILNEQKSGLIIDGERVESLEGKRNFHLGVQDEQVWNKRFKVRFTSRKTGRKIDLNISFKHNNLKRVDNGGKILNEGTNQ